MTAPEISKRKNQPRCQTCSHPKSFHGDGGKCRALGCTGCSDYVPPRAKA